jgi:8-oxo-dGTP pyrophosphatase MutT (NUDIX family)
LAMRHSKRNNLTARIEPRKRLPARVNQIAALVYRWNGDVLEVLLVTSRESRRWILPKGWPVAGKTPAASAAQEADEEAGILGHVMKKPIGRYSAVKRIGEAALPCDVEVYPLEFAKQKQKWKERGERACRWLPIDEAEEAIAEPELAALIHDFAHEMRGPARISQSA